MLQFSESKADAHNKIISVLLRHAQKDTRANFCFGFWTLLFELHEKTLGSQKYAYVFFEK